MPSRTLRFARRLGVAAPIAAILLSTIGLGASSAANSRTVSFGSPGADGGGINIDTGQLIPGTLLFTPVTAGNEPGRTAVDVLITNAGGQTLNHIKFAGGYVADQLPYNPAFTVEGTNPPASTPSGTSFPPDVALTHVFEPAGALPCDVYIVDPSPTNTGEDGLSCDVGTLAANQSALYTIVFTPPHTNPGTFDIWLTVSWNEGWSTTGANADYAFAKGKIVVGTATCATAASGYYLSGDTVDLDANGGGQCQGQQASIASGDPLGVGLRGKASVLINNDNATYTAQCPAELKNKCFGVTVEAQVLDGAAVDGGVEWTVRWYGVKSLSGAVHFPNDYTASSLNCADPVHPNTAGCYTVIPFSKDNVCVDTATVTDTNCWVMGSKMSSAGGEKPVWFQITFRTPNNGRGGGYS